MKMQFESKFNHDALAFENKFDNRKFWILTSQTCR